MKEHYDGDLVVTEESDKEWLGKLKSISGCLRVLCNAKLDVLESVGGYIDVREGAALELPVCQSVGSFIDVYQNAALELPVCQSVGGYIYVREGAALELPVCQSVGGSIDVYQNAALELPVCQSVGGYIYVREGAALELPVCQSVGSFIEVREGAALELPVCQSVGGSIDVREGAALELPVCQSVGGSIDVYSKAKFLKPDTLKNNWGEKNGDTYSNVIYADNIYTPFKDLKIKNIEGKEITIYRPACNGVLWTVTDGNYWSHGKTIKQAVADLNFKYLKQNKDKLKELDKNKLYTVEEIINFYRIITGACLAGCEQFVKSNCNKKEYTIKEVIEIVRKNRAYNYEKFVEFYG